jgi:hypothetical protein
VAFCHDQADAMASLSRRILIGTKATNLDSFSRIAMQARNRALYSSTSSPHTPQNRDA